MAWVTEHGYIPEHVKIQIQDVQTLVIESNFEESLLKEDAKRPLSIKQRIRGRHGHLSNQATLEFLIDAIPNSRIECLHIAHLSFDCNNIYLVLEISRKLKEKFSHLEIHVVDPNLEFTLTSGKF